MVQSFEKKIQCFLTNIILKLKRFKRIFHIILFVVKENQFSPYRSADHRIWNNNQLRHMHSNEIALEKLMKNERKSIL